MTTHESAAQELETHLGYDLLPSKKEILHILQKHFPSSSLPTTEGAMDTLAVKSTRKRIGVWLDNIGNQLRSISHCQPNRQEVIDDIKLNAKRLIEGDDIDA